MEEDLKKKRYERISENLDTMFAETASPVSRMATASAVLHHKIKQFFWTGFYFLEDNGDLSIGPYQGPVIQMVLKKGQGVCQECIEKGNTNYVPDVSNHPGYIHCNDDTKAELAIPVKDKSGKIIGVLDINSHTLDGFNEDDIAELEKIADKIFA